MEETAEVQCPYCGQTNEVLVDTSLETTRFTIDCEVCCRPIEVVAACEPGRILALEVSAG